MTITKADLVQQIYNKYEELTKGQATEAVEAFFRISKDTLIGEKQNDKQPNWLF